MAPRQSGISGVVSGVASSVEPRNAARITTGASPAVGSLMMETHSIVKTKSNFPSSRALSSISPLAPA